MRASGGIAAGLPEQRVGDKSPGYPRLWVGTGYDGSPDAPAAVAAAAEVLSARKAVVVHVWHSAAPGAVGLMPGAVLPPTPEADAAAGREARAVVTGGVRLAQRQGFDAEPVLQQGVGAGEIADALIGVAEGRQGSALVVGRRGVGRVRAVLLGSVSDAVVRHADRPVLVVPSPDGDDSSEAS